MSTKRYLYVAQALSDPRIKKQNVFKVGYSTQPMTRIDTLGGSGSTATYKLILVLELPSAVKDIHVLAHHNLDPFVVHRHVDLQRQYVSVFGHGHRLGVQRRREIVMFGPRYTLPRIKALFRRIVAGMKSPVGTYVCTDENCLSTGGVTYCGVCVKFMKSLVNTITYQSGVSSRALGRKRSLDDAGVLISALIGKTRELKKYKWRGPSVGDFWILRPTVHLLDQGCRFLLVAVQSRNEQRRTSRVQWWSCASADTLDTMAKFTPDGNTDTLSWDGGGWQCQIRTKQHVRFMRILDLDKVLYYVRQWRVSTRGTQ